MMKEYKITFKAEKGIIFKQTVQGMDVVKANSATEAMEKWQEEHRLKLYLINRMDNVNFSILSIEEI